MKIHKKNNYATIASILIFTQSGNKGIFISGVRLRGQSSNLDFPNKKFVLLNGPNSTCIMR